MATPARELRRPVFARFYAWVSPRMEPEAMGDYLRGLAKAAAADASVAITVTAGIAGQLPFPAGSFDVGVVSLMLCSVDDQRAAFAELYRVIRPGGQLPVPRARRGADTVLRGVQRAADPRSGH